MSIFTCWIRFACPLEGTGYKLKWVMPLLRKSFKWVFDKGFPVLPHSASYERVSIFPQLRPLLKLLTVR